MTPAVLPEQLEDTIRREALKAYLAGGEEQALDLLAVARAIAGPAAHLFDSGRKRWPAMSGAQLETIFCDRWARWAEAE